MDTIHKRVLLLIYLHFTHSLVELVPWEERPLGVVYGMDQSLAANQSQPHVVVLVTHL